MTFTAGKARLQLKDKAPDRKDQLDWKWLAGAATLLGDFTSPSRRTISVAGLHDGGDTWYGLRDDSHTNRYTFTVQDEGAAYQLGALHDFFTALPFWRMQPFDGVTGSAVVDRQRPWVNPTPPRAAEPPA